MIYMSKINFQNLNFPPRWGCCCLFVFGYSILTSSLGYFLISRKSSLLPQVYYEATQTQQSNVYLFSFRFHTVVLCELYVNITLLDKI